MKRSITVSGLGRVAVAPDVADVRLGVSVTRPTVGEARGAAAEVATRILDAVTATGVARADIRTSSLQVQPDYEYSERTQRLRGQNVSPQYLVTVRSRDTLGRVIDDALAAGATTLDGVAFRSGDPSKAEAAARIAAVRDAREKAEALAGEAGVALGDVLAIARRPARCLARWEAAADAGCDEAAPTPVEAGTDEVAIAIVVTFAIPGPAA
jgi:uncharacterized protein YggE